MANTKEYDSFKTKEGNVKIYNPNHPLCRIEEPDD